MVGFKGGGARVACLSDGTHRGNPAVFSCRYYDELMAITGDKGAKGLLAAHADDLAVITCAGENELADCDTQEALEQMAGN